jgi:uncharacterized protein YndB with AHSA1/START domain
VRTVRVQKAIEAPAEAIFDLISDHAGYRRFRGISDSRLVREGAPPPNGVGAMRWVRTGLLRFEEEIVAYERPRRMDYVIKKINSPLEHELGSIRLTPVDGRTEAEWTSTFRVPVPVLGRAMESVWAIGLARGFRRVLEDVERMLI